MVVDGNGTPTSGPKDIVIVGNTIAEVVPLDPVALKDGRAKRPEGDTEIDATGKYVLPGLINAHGHVQYERGGIPQPVDYCLKLWLACGITTVRDVGSDTKKALPLRDSSARGEVASPRLFIYTMFGYPPSPRNAEEARALTCPMFAGSAPASMIDDTNAANSGADQPLSRDNSVCTKSSP
jgi:hypothetical protein